MLALIPTYSKHPKLTALTHTLSWVQASRNSSSSQRVAEDLQSSLTLCSRGLFLPLAFTPFIVGFGRAEVAPLHKILSKSFSLLKSFAPEVHFYPRSLTPLAFNMIGIIVTGVLAEALVEVVEEGCLDLVGRSFLAGLEVGG